MSLESALTRGETYIQCAVDLGNWDEDDNIASVTDIIADVLCVLQSHDSGADIHGIVERAVYHAEMDRFEDRAGRSTWRSSYTPSLSDVAGTDTPADYEEVQTP